MPLGQGLVRAALGNRADQGSLASKVPVLGSLKTADALLLGSEARGADQGVQGGQEIQAWQMQQLVAVAVVPLPLAFAHLALPS